MDLGLKHRVAVVTGSSRGLGRSIAEQLAGEGATVVVTYRSNRDAADAVADDIRRRDGQVSIVALDLTSAESIDRAVTQVLELFGRVDVLVNNAVAWGLRPPAAALKLHQFSLKEWQHGVRANVEGTYAVTRAVLPSMYQQQWGRIVTISSIAAVDGLAGASWYATAKAALHGLTCAIANEGGGCGVLANVVMPGLMVGGTAGDGIANEAKVRAAASSAVGRLLSPAEVGAAVVFLASGANTAVTGQVVRASGGHVTA